MTTRLTKQTDRRYMKSPRSGSLASRELSRSNKIVWLANVGSKRPMCSCPSMRAHSSPRLLCRHPAQFLPHPNPIWCTDIVLAGVASSPRLLARHNLQFLRGSQVRSSPAKFLTRARSARSAFAYLSIRKRPSRRFLYRHTVLFLLQL
jgi:hypothetical protein